MKIRYPGGRMESDILRVPTSGVNTGWQVPNRSLLMFRRITDRIHSATARHEHEAERNANVPAHSPSNGCLCSNRARFIV